MNYLDYRKKLGIGFNDSEVERLFLNRIRNHWQVIRSNSTYDHVGTPEMVFEYSNIVGADFENMDTTYCLDSIIEDLIDEENIREFLAKYAVLLHLIKDNKQVYSFFSNMLKDNLSDSGIPYEIIEDDDGLFIFPKGARELDDALVSEPLDWLKDYRQAHKTYCIALKQYADGVYIRDVADNLRKALEDFLREFLGNNNDFNKNKKEVETYLKSQNVDSHLITILVALLTHYYLLNNEVAKHNDKMDKKYLEFLLYQTGIFIRTLIIVKREEDK